MLNSRINNSFSAVRSKMVVQKSKVVFWIACHFQGHCPTVKEQKNNMICFLAKRLKGISDKETLTNILEWEDRNVQFWNERHPMPLIFVPLFFCSVFISLFLTVFIVFKNIKLAPLFTSIYFDAWLTIFASGGLTALTMIAWVIHSNRKVSTTKGLWNAFIPSISINMLLEPRLGICRDYAKLTACLLLNADFSEVYFVPSFGHVAAGVKVNEEIYMLDQHLPLTTLRQWCLREHGTDDSSKILYPYNSVQKLAASKLEQCKLKDVLGPKKTELQKESEFFAQMSKLLGVPFGWENSSSSQIEISKWRKGIKMYLAGDEIVNYSLARAIKKKMSNELIDFYKAKRVCIKRDKDDLVLSVETI